MSEREDGRVLELQAGVREQREDGEMQVRYLQRLAGLAGGRTPVKAIQARMYPLRR